MRGKASSALLGTTAKKNETSNVDCRVHSRTEALVDVRPLLEPGPGCPCGLGPFRAGEVYEVDLGESALALVRGIFLVHLVQEATQHEKTGSRLNESNNNDARGVVGATPTPYAPMGGWLCAGYVCTPPWRSCG